MDKQEMILNKINLDGWSKLIVKATFQKIADYYDYMFYVVSKRI